MGALVGLLGGYFLSEVLLDAGRRTYAVTAQVKAVGAASVLVGVAGSTLLFGVTAHLCYFFVKGREPGELISGGRSGQGISRAAMLSFNVCIILGKSLNISSRQVFQMQTKGHNYDYETEYSEFRTGAVSERVLPYAAVSSAIRISGREIRQNLVGLYDLSSVYELESGGMPLTVPEPGTVYINPGLREVYGVKVGDTIRVELDGTGYDLRVSGIAFNAQAATIYLAASELTEWLGLPAGAYNGVLGMGEPVTDTLRTGAAVGCILIFLALYINFQDQIRDMLILHMTGYQEKAIRALLVDIYLPVLRTAFIITLLPAIELVKAIHRSLSVSTADYMPFGTSVSVMILTCILLHMIYWLVQRLFSIGIKWITKKENIAEFTAFE